MNYLSTTISQLKQSSPAQTEFYQAVEEVLRTLARIQIISAPLMVKR